MKKITLLLPHIVFYAIFFGLLGFAFVTDSGELGTFYGLIVGAITDPIIIIGSAIVGLVTLHQRYLILASLIFAIIASYLISQINAEWLGTSHFNLELVCARFFAVIFISYLFNFAKLIFK